MFLYNIINVIFIIFVTTIYAITKYYINKHYVQNILILILYGLYTSSTVHPYREHLFDQPFYTLSLLPCNALASQMWEFVSYDPPTYVTYVSTTNVSNIIFALILYLT
uniref:Uncharacterized protein n=1 Tax=Anopheles arabiensis TaxID=7173 RepID=A0A182IHK6_ANOAR